MKLSHLRPLTVLSLLILILMVVTSAMGLFVAGTYRDNPATSAALRGNDLVTLVLAAPLLGAVLERRRRTPQLSVRWLLLWMAMLLYALYNYVFYLFGAAINVCFIGYIALAALSVWGLIVGLSGLDVDRIAATYRQRTPVRWVAGYMFFFGLFLGGLWVSRIVGFMITGVVPQDIVQTGRDTGVVYAIDLTLLIPTLLVTAIWLWRRSRWGLLVAPIIMMKCSAYVVALIVMSPFAEAAGMAGAWDLVPLWAALGIGAFASTWALFRNMRVEDAESSAA